MKKKTRAIQYVVRSNVFRPFFPRQSEAREGYSQTTAYFCFLASGSVGFSVFGSVDVISKLYAMMYRSMSYESEC